MEDYLISVPQLAKRLKVSKGVAYDLVNLGIIRHLIVGSKKVRNEEVNRFLRDYEGQDLTDLSNIKPVELGGGEEIENHV